MVMSSRTPKTPMIIPARSKPFILVRGPIVANNIPASSEERPVSLVKFIKNIERIAVRNRVINEPIIATVVFLLSPWER